MIRCDRCERPFNPGARARQGDGNLCKECAVKSDPGSYVCDRCEQLNCICGTYEFEEYMDRKER
jgi:hypothetical protein